MVGKNKKLYLYGKSPLMNSERETWALQTVMIDSNSQSAVVN